MAETHVSQTSRPLAAAVFCACLVAGNALGQQTQLDYQQTVVDEQVAVGAAPKSEARPAAKTTAEKVTVGLGDHYLSVQRGQQKIIYDLAAKRMIAVDLQRGEYVDHSLFAEVAFRVAELRNRQSLMEDLSGAGIDKGRNPFDRFQMECLFSMELPEAKGGPVEIKTETQGGVTTFLHDGQWAARVTASPHTLPEPAAGLFARFLAYQCNLHPQVRRKIVEAGKVPAELAYRYSNPPHAYTVTWAFRRLTDGRPKGLPLGQEFEAAADTEGPLADVLAELKRQKTPSSARAAEQFARSAMADKQYLDALLGVIEYRLQSDESMSELMREIAAHAESDPQLSRLIQGISLGSDPRTAADALKALDAIDRTPLKKGHVIDIFRANDQASLKRPKEAKKLFLAVLKINPFIGGVYKDLGDLYAASYNMDLAWRCWDTARGLYPKHSLLKDVGARERWYQEHLPDFLAPQGTN